MNLRKKESLSLKRKTLPTIVNLLPIARGYGKMNIHCRNGDFMTGSSPGSGSSYSRAFPELYSSDITYALHSPLQWRDRSGLTPEFPIKPNAAKLLHDGYLS